MESKDEYEDWWWSTHGQYGSVGLYCEIWYVWNSVRWSLIEWLKDWNCDWNMEAIYKNLSFHGLKGCLETGLTASKISIAVKISSLQAIIKLRYLVPWSSN